jgi:hypothetical protein
MVGIKYLFGSPVIQPTLEERRYLVEEKSMVTTLDRRRFLKGAVAAPAILTIDHAAFRSLSLAGQDPAAEADIKALAKTLGKRY